MTPDTVSEEVKLIRNMIRSTAVKFVIMKSTERDSFLYLRSTGRLTTTTATIQSDSLQPFNVGENKVKYLFKVE